MLFLLLDTTGTSGFPLITHKAISWVENGNRFVMHNPRHKYPVIEHIEDFINSGRKIKGISFIELNKNPHEYHNKNKHRKFNLLKYNCEHFYYGFIKNKEYSPQLKLYSLLALYAGYNVIYHGKK